MAGEGVRTDRQNGKNEVREVVRRQGGACRALNFMQSNKGNHWRTWNRGGM